MTLIDLLRSPWAVIPDRLDEIQAIYAVHLRGEKIDLEALEARLGRPLANEQREYRVEEGGVGVLSLSGVISPKANLFTRVSGGASAQVFANQINSMAADPQVRSAIIDIDSPGGSVLGIPAAAAALRALSEVKPTVTVGTGTVSSAGYWIGSAANSIYLSGETDMAGSIGVVANHSYDPRAMQGKQTTEIVAGKYKRIVSETAPLTKEGRAYMQAQVDEIYRVFVETVAQNRKVPVDAVLANMADGRVFIGQQAVNAGLVDGFATVETMIERMATDPMKYAKRRKAVFALGATSSAGVADAQAPTDEAMPVSQAATPKTNQESAMTPQEIAVQFAAENPEAAALVRAEGATAELARIRDVRAAALPGHEALIEALAFDGKTTGAEAALAIIKAERESRATHANSRSADAVEPVVSAETRPAEATEADAATYELNASPATKAAVDAKVRKHMAANSCDYFTALKAVTGV